MIVSIFAETKYGIIVSTIPYQIGLGYLIYQNMCYQFMHLVGLIIAITIEYRISYDFWLYLLLPYIAFAFYIVNKTESKLVYLFMIQGVYLFLILHMKKFNLSNQFILSN